MRILILPAYFQPEKFSGKQLITDRNEAFIKAGREVCVFTPVPSRGVHPLEAKHYKQNKTESLHEGMMIVHRFKLMQEKKNPILRAIRYLLQNVKQFNRAAFTHYGRNSDVMLIASTPPTQGFMAAMIKKITKVPVVYNLQDIFPDSLAGAGMAKHNGILWKIGRVVENITYRNADRIIVISDDFKKNIMAKGVPEEKIVVVYNWVDENAVVPVAKEDNPLYDDLGINREKFSIVYAGNFGHAQNIDVTIAAAERLREVEDIQFLMFGTGGLVEDYKKIAQEKGLENMFFFPLQPAEKVSQVYSLGDLGVVACKKGLGKGAFPSKTWSIMSAGTPVIANYDEDTDLERLVKEKGLGVFSAADDSEQMAERIMEMYNNRGVCAEYGRNARQYILDNVSKEKSTQKYVDMIKEVVEENRNKKSKK